MDSRLYTFLMVDKTKNYTRAAENLNLTQPAVYKQIKYLENYYGVNLFIKDGRRLKLTDEGEILRNYAHQIINIHEELKEKLQEKDFSREKYRIGATMTIGAYILPRIIYKYMDLNNNIDISLTVNNTNMILQKLLDREISMAVIEGPFDKIKFKYKKFKDDELVLIGPTNGRLAEINKISIDELLKENFILREKFSGTREIIESLLISKGYSHDVLNNHMEINSINGIKTLVEEGVGLSILSKESVKREIDLKTLKIISIKDITIVRELNFVYIYDKDMDFIERFINFSLRKEVAEDDN